MDNITENRISSLSIKAKELLLVKVANLIAEKSNQQTNLKKQIVAYITPKEEFDLGVLKKNLKETLPNYMYPSSINVIDEMPLLPNGKIDRKNLHSIKSNSTTNIQPKEKVNSNSIESVLTSIWEDVLGFSPIRDSDNFFEIGGDSILSIRIVSKAKKAGIDLNSNDIFKHQTINELLANIAKNPINTDKLIVEKEQKLTEIWEDVLGFSPIKNTDNFFEIGGDSILSIRIVSKAKKAGIDLNSNDIFKHQTINELLANIVKNPINTDKLTIEKEQKLTEIWEDVLGFSPIKNTDNFFEIGGDSILSIQIVSKAKKAGIDLNSNDIFEYQTINELLANIVKNPINTDKLIVEKEQKLTEIWEDVLGFSPIKNTDNFFEIGGDSILSIQIVSKAKKVGINLKSNDIFEYQTINELKNVAKTDSIKSNNNLILGKVPLTPIQHWFFENHINTPNFWNQAIKLDNIPNLSEHELSNIIQSLITEHDILRSSFKKTPDSWETFILKPENINALEYINLTHLKDFDQDKIQEQYLATIQNKFNLSEGSLFKCVYFSNDQNSFCILLAHHLVIDAVSWQILTDQFIEATSSNTTIEAKSSSVKEWINCLNNKSFDNEVSYWKEQIDFSKKLPYDIEDSTIIEEKDITSKSFTLDRKTTLLLKGAANKSYNTKTEELITAAFVGAINEWTQSSDITIGFEKHGRETLFNDLIDLSKTVGWLTSYFPTKFNSDYFYSGNIPELIISTKERMRKVPNGGVGYGVLRYLKNTFGKIGNPEIVLNYLGIINNNDNPISVTPISEGLRSASSERTYKFEINAYIKNNEFYCNWSFSRKMYSSETIENLIKNFEQKLNLVITHCNQSNTQNYTPSDFTEVDINQNDLDHLLDILD